MFVVRLRSVAEGRATYHLPATIWITPLRFCVVLSQLTYLVYVLLLTASYPCHRSSYFSRDKPYQTVEGQLTHARIYISTRRDLIKFLTCHELYRKRLLSS